MLVVSSSAMVEGDPTDLSPITIAVSELELLDASVEKTSVNEPRAGTGVVDDDIARVSVEALIDDASTASGVGATSVDKLPAVDESPGTAVSEVVLFGD